MLRHRYNLGGLIEVCNSATAMISYSSSSWDDVPYVLFAQHTYLCGFLWRLDH